MLSQYINNNDIIYLGQILLSVLLGSILGIQRQRLGKSAGPRTHALVTAGSCMFTILSLNFFSSNDAMVASAIVTGIGFLCAGTILHKANRTEGLTTAAGLWMGASVGMAVGAKEYFLSVAVTLIMLVVLMINDRPLKKDCPDLAKTPSKRKIAD